MFSLNNKCKKKILITYIFVERCEKQFHFRELKKIYIYKNKVRIIFTNGKIKTKVSVILQKKSYRTESQNQNIFTITSKSCLR